MNAAAPFLQEKLRKRPRFPVRLSIEFSDDEIHGQGTVTSLSRSGCTLESTATVTTGSAMRMQIPLPGGEPPIAVELAVVRWATVGTFGVEFIILPAGSQDRLRRFLSNL